MSKLLNIGAFLLTFIVCVCSEFMDSPMSLRSFSGSEARLKCVFVAPRDVTVVQVTWSRHTPAGTTQQIITGHYTEGPKVSPEFADGFRFESPDPLTDSTLLIENTVRADEGVYTCSIATFPSGNFQRRISLSVWMYPISSVEHVVLKEGQSYGIAASCRAVAHPPARLSWDTDVSGQSQNRSGDGGVVTTQFSLYPSRSMNGQKLDCLVWHPVYEEPHRLINKLVVQFPPDAEAVGSGSWQIGSSGSEIRCLVKGNPLPQNVSWSRSDGVLPSGVLVQKDRLVFSRPLQQTDEGVYVCRTHNTLGVAKAEFTLQIDAVRSEFSISSSHTLLIVIGAASAGVLVLFVVFAIIYINCNLSRKNRKLKRALSARTEEMISLSRQVSMRRLDSINCDPRAQAEDSSLSRMDSGMKNSVLSVEDRSLLSDVRCRQGDGEFDSLGRPAIYTSYRPERQSKKLREIEEEKNERRRRVESFVRSSNMSLDSGLRDQCSPPASVSSGPTAEANGDGWKRGSRREIHRVERERDRLPEGEEENSALLSETASNYFQCSNSGLVPKTSINGGGTHLRGQVI